MIIGDNRGAVIENIRRAAESGDFYAKVELNDPVLTAAEAGQITDRYIADHKRVPYRIKAWTARRIAGGLTRVINARTEIVGLEKIPAIAGGAVITSNHFGPLENTVIRHLTNRLGRKLDIVSQVSNFAMKGALGFIMRYTDTIPLSDDSRYLAGDFVSLLAEKTGKNDMVLIYPEQEMWFNYRKPRPPKRGAYRFAAQLGVPVICCFVEIVDLGEKDTDEFNKVRYILHILDVLFPDPDKGVRENSFAMCARDYELKKAAYEQIYGESLNYDFSPEDIAGWVGA